ncbi:MAG: sigma-54 dependent transcriptional regulator [Myxococcota bacterium]
MAGDGLGAETREPNRAPASADRLVLVLRVLFHPDRARIGEQATVAPTASFELSRLEPAFAPSGGGPPRPLADAFLSRSPVRFGSDNFSLHLEQPSRPTALAIDGQQIEREARLERPALERGVVLELAERVILWLQLLPESRPDPEDFGLIGSSSAMRQVRHQIRTYAPLAIPALIRGATGTGKELVARALHQAGPRARGPFVAINVATLSAGVAASELFGHKKGAFTGAEADRLGLFQEANGGTLFLDEIGEASLELQAQLLRALETSSIQPVGAGREVPVDVRVIAATDADLSTERFRAALLHRLQGCDLRLPALSERREDVGPLLAFLLDQEARQLGLSLPARTEEEGWIPFDIARRLIAQAWPGNVRQLRNVARQMAVLLAQGDSELRGLQLAPEKSGSLPAAKPSARPAEITDEALLAALEQAEWRLERAATALGISRTSLYRRIETHPSLKKSKDLGRPEIEAALTEAGGDLDRAARALRVSKAGLRLRMSAIGARGPKR